MIKITKDLIEKHRSLPFLHILYGPFLSGKGRMRKEISELLTSLEISFVEIDIDQIYIKIYYECYKEKFLNLDVNDLTEELQQLYRKEASSIVNKISDEMFEKAILENKHIIIESGGNYNTNNNWLTNELEKMPYKYYSILYYPVVDLETSLTRKLSRKSQINPPNELIISSFKRAPDLFFKKLVGMIDSCIVYSNENSHENSKKNFHENIIILKINNKITINSFEGNSTFNQCLLKFQSKN